MTNRQLFLQSAAALCLGALVQAGIPSEAHASVQDQTAYERAYFDRFNPATALDIVDQIPGFSIAEDDGRRGLAAAVGNVLIDGKRPAGKGNSLSERLAGISADDVIRVEIMRGADVEADVGSYDVLANIILARENETSRVWTANGYSSNGHFGWGSEIGVRSNIKQWSIHLAAARRSGIDALTGEVVLTRPQGLDEFWLEDFAEEAVVYSLSASARGNVANAPVELSITTSWRDEMFGGLSRRAREDGLLREVQQTGDADLQLVNAGLTVGLPWISGLDWRLKIAANRSQRDGAEAQQASISGQAFASERQEAFVRSGESIVRLEGDGAIGRILHLAIGGEVAHTFLDQELFLFESGVGESVPGSDTRVDEKRAEVLATLTAKASPKLTLVGTAAIEGSTIRQEGDFDRERSFYFFKPSLVASWKPNEGREWRLAMERSVGQLDFGDFAASIELDDERVTVGNPELRPQRSWRAKVSHVRSAGQDSRLELFASVEHVDDLIEYIPLQGGGDAVGNIGDGKSATLGFEWSTTLDRLGVSQAKLELSGRARWTRVVDPVTLAQRRFGNERWGVLEVNLDKRFGPHWAVDLAFDARTAEYEYRVDEVERSKRPIGLDIGVERSLFAGVKMRLEIANLLDGTQRRTRRQYDENRASDPVDRSLERRRNFGRTLSVQFNGSF